MMKFFALDAGEPCGGFTPGHMGAVMVCIILITTAILLTYKRNMDMDNFLMAIGLICAVFEVVKIAWGLSVHRYSNYANYIPLWFCSLFVPASIAAGFCKGKIRRVALSFMYYGGMIGGMAYLLFPATSLFKFPLFHFISVHSMLYHSLMIYTGLTIVWKKVFVPNPKDFLPYFAVTTIACVLAYQINAVCGTNLMFLNRPSNNEILKNVLDFAGAWYPAVITLCQNIGTFVVSYGLYEGILYFVKKQNQEYTQYGFIR